MESWNVDVNSDTLKKETPCYSHAVAFGTGSEVLISALEKWELWCHLSNFCILIVRTNPTDAYLSKKRCFFLFTFFDPPLTPILGLMFSYAKQTCILAEFPWHWVMWEWDGGKLYDFERKLAFVKALFGVCHNCTCISWSVLQRNFLLRVKMFQLKLFSTRGKCLRAQPLLAQEHCFICGDWNSNFLWEAFAIETDFDFRSKCFDFKGGIQELQLLLIAPQPFIVVLL